MAYSKMQVSSAVDCSVRSDVRLSFEIKDSLEAMVYVHKQQSRLLSSNEVDLNYRLFHLRQRLARSLFSAMKACTRNRTCPLSETAFLLYGRLIIPREWHLHGSIRCYYTQFNSQEGKQAKKNEKRGDQNLYG